MNLKFPQPNVTFWYPNATGKNNPSAIASIIADDSVNSSFVMPLGFEFLRPGRNSHYTNSILIKRRESEKLDSYCEQYTL